MKHSIGLNPIAGTLTTIFTIPTGFKADVNSLFISNATGNNKHFTIYWQHAHDVSHKVYIVTEAIVAPNSYIQYTDSLVMQSGDSLHFNSEAGSAPSVIASFDFYKEAPTNAFGGE
jgi:hypothetical protein